MTTSVQPIGVPDWDIEDRMRKSLRAADLSVQTMADYLGVSRNTVGSWINGRITPSRQSILLWALRTGVPATWLEHGETPPPAGPDGGVEVPPARFELATKALGVLRSLHSVAGSLPPAGPATHPVPLAPAA